MRVADPPAGTRNGAVAVPEETNRTAKRGPLSFVRSNWFASLVVLAIIVGIELIQFGVSYKRTGFYLDDWLMLRQFAFGPQSYVDMIVKYLTTDPRVLIRPIEALHFGTVFYFSGTDPTGWRVSNMVMEIASAFLIYLIVARLALSRMLGFLAAIFFVAYPVHDSTHYWAVASCVSLSLVLYLASLWSTLKSTADGASKKVWLSAAYVFFALSIYGYEPFLPLCALNVVSYVVLTSGWTGIVSTFRKLALHAAPYAGIIASLLVYQRYIVPLFAKAALHKIHFEPGLLLSTVAEGLRVVSPVVTAPYVYGQVDNFMRTDGISGGSIVRFAIIAGIVALGALVTVDANNVSRKQAASLLLLGLFTAAISYSIFGLNPEYTPTLVTLVNRINTGAAFGVAMIFAGLIGLCFGTSNRVVKVAATTILTSCLLIVFSMTNWSLGKTWEISWAVQQKTFEALRERASDFETAQSVLIMNCPRYVNSTPVFDGPWDFEEMLHLALKRSDIRGGVVSERMTVGDDIVQDVTFKFACAEYPYKNLVLITPGLTTVAPVSTPTQFIDVVEHEGRMFGLADETINKWRGQVALGTRKQKNGVLVPLAVKPSEELLR